MLIACTRCEAEEELEVDADRGDLVPVICELCGNEWAEVLEL